jgi:hypothetical protein
MLKKLHGVNELERGGVWVSRHLVRLWLVHGGRNNRGRRGAILLSLTRILADDNEHTRRHSPSCTFPVVSSNVDVAVGSGGCQRGVWQSTLCVMWRLMCVVVDVVCDVVITMCVWCQHCAFCDGYALRG